MSTTKSKKPSPHRDLKRVLKLKARLDQLEDPNVRAALHDAVQLRVEYLIQRMGDQHA